MAHSNSDWIVQVNIYFHGLLLVPLCTRSFIISEKLSSCMATNLGTPPFEFCDICFIRPLNT